MPSRGIQDIGVLSQCVNLQRLNLSDNLLTSVLLLAPLKSLQYLNVSNNRIETLGGVESMDALQYLNAAGNSIASFSALEPLRGKQLRSIILCEKSRDQISPVCRIPGYCAFMLELVPHLTVLDGEHLSGSAKELFDLFQEFDSQRSNANPLISAVNKPEPFLHEGFWDHTSSGKQDDVVDSARQQFEVLARECKKLNSEAMAAVLKEQSRLPSNKIT